MSSEQTLVTPQQEKDADVASSSIKRDIQRHASAADEMIQSIRNELFTPPGAAAANMIDDEKSLLGDDDDLGDEINRLSRVQDDIRQEVDAQNVESIVMVKKKAPENQKTVDVVSTEERSGLILFVLIAFWVIVYIKQWIEYNMPGRIQT